MTKKGKTKDKFKDLNLVDVIEKFSNYIIQQPVEIAGLQKEIANYLFQECNGELEDVTVGEVYKISVHLTLRLLGDYLIIDKNPKRKEDDSLKGSEYEGLF